MPSTIPVSPADDTGRGPQPAPGVPDPSKDKPATPPVTDEDDAKKPDDAVLDPALLLSAIRPAWPEEAAMSTTDSNVTPEQKKPRDVHRPPGKPSHADEKSKAPPMVQPAGARDESEKPVVNPVTGGVL